MRTLYLLRHAKSRTGSPAQSDHERGLGGRGRKACRVLARHFRQAAIKPELVLCSTALRARETWELLTEALGQVFPTRYERGLYLAEPGDLLQRIRHLDRGLAAVLVVGHNPGIELLAQTLAGNHEDSPYRQLKDKFPTGGLATLVFTGMDWGEVAPNSGRLVAFVTPAGLGA